MASDVAFGFACSLLQLFLGGWCFDGPAGPARFWGGPFRAGLSDDLVRLGEPNGRTELT